MAAAAAGSGSSAGHRSRAAWLPHWQCHVTSRIPQPTWMAGHLGVFQAAGRSPWNLQSASSRRRSLVMEEPQAAGSTPGMGRKQQWKAV